MAKDKTHEFKRREKFSKLNQNYFVFWTRVVFIIA